MRKTNKILLTALFATSVTSVQADGFFDKIFGSSSKGGASFETLLSHVPADTSYLLTNKKTMPDDVVSFHLNRGKNLIKTFSDLNKKQSKDKKLEGTEAFFAALFNDFGEKIDADKLEETGLSLKLISMIYGLDTMPVVRMTISSKEKLMATIKQAEEKSKYKVEFTKCGEYDCLVDKVDGTQSVALVILENHLAASLFASIDKDKVIDHLTGKSSPKDAYSMKTWDAFLEENDYKGYGEGFVDLKKLSVLVKPKIMESFGEIDPKESKGCMAVADEHINNMPKIIMGTKSFAVKQVDYEMVFKTSSDVSSVLQGIANPTNIVKRVDSPIFDFGVNINFVKMRDALTQYSNFLIKSGKTNNCSSIKAKEIRKGMGGIMMAMNMGLTQFKSVYFAISDIDMQKQKADAYVSIGTDDPSGLLGMVGMLSPKLMGFQVPTDGSTVKLPDGVIPAKGMPLPPVYLSRTAKSLNVMVGNEKPNLTDYKRTTPEIMSLTMDGKRYYQQMANVMKMIPTKSSETDKENFSKIMETTGDMMGIYDQQISADKRGMVFSYQIHYK